MHRRNKSEPLRLSKIIFEDCISYITHAYLLHVQHNLWFKPKYGTEQSFYYVIFTLNMFLLCLLSFKVIQKHFKSQLVLITLLVKLENCYMYTEI